MPTKKLIIIGTVLLLVALMIWTNTGGEGAAEKTTGDGAASQPTSLQKDLPAEEKIPSH
jgi:hypothetical protein